jgi:hypothetical protein
MLQQNYNATNYVPRGTIVFLQILGTVFAACGLIAYIILISDVAAGLGGTDVSRAVAALILGILVYLAWKTIYTAVVIIRFVNKSSDEEIVANRWIISALSLNLGGFMTPFIMTALPNIPTQSTIKPRWFLTKAMGMTALVGAPLGLIAYFLSLTTGTLAISSAQLFDTTQSMGVISLIMLVLPILLTLFGAISVALFYQKNSQQIFDQGNTGFATMMNVVAVIWLAVITVELFLTMVMAIIRLIGAIMDFFRAMSSDGAGKFFLLFFALLNLVITFAYVSYLLYLTSRTMVGIWSPTGVQYRTYEKLSRAQANRKTQNSTY